ncbi:MAG TPA: hypothetical protein VM344_03955 [Vitreimonas sp.]|nr:hypothetical protein [Vitreimonas sp.]
MADLPLPLEDPLAERLARALDVEGKIPRALEALGPIGGKDVLLLDGAGSMRARQVEAAGGRVHHAADLEAAASQPPESIDVALAWWSSFRPIEDDDLESVDRLLRPGGRQLVVHDYGRDDVSRLRGELPEYGSWARRDGPFLSRGFRIRVLHCWWTFDSVEEAAGFLGEVFGPRGANVAAGLKRPRLSYNVAVYHRTRGDRG